MASLSLHILVFFSSLHTRMSKSHKKEENGGEGREGKKNWQQKLLHCGIKDGCGVDMW